MTQRQQMYKTRFLVLISTLASLFNKFCSILLKKNKKLMSDVIHNKKHGLPILLTPFFLKKDISQVENHTTLNISRIF